ncbi:MAG: hypothetical protein IT565_13910 [Rhodospirillales bacterium]|nr:hypothetical protein [Rhodospirillales bacterium]
MEPVFLVAGYIIGAIFIIGAVISINIIPGRLKNNKLFRIRSEIIARFGESDIYISSNNFSVIAFYFKEGKILLGKYLYLLRYNFNSIIKAEIIRNGVSLTSPDRGAQAFGAIMGGVGFGLAGAFVGALMASSATEERIKKLSIRIITNDPKNPIYEFLLMELASDKKGLSPDDLTAKPILEFGDKIYALLLIAMRQAEDRVRPRGS